MRRSQLYDAHGVPYATATPPFFTDDGLFYVVGWGASLRDDSLDLSLSHLAENKGIVRQGPSLKSPSSASLASMRLTPRATICGETATADSEVSL